jgi:hypothetical protein
MRWDIRHFTGRHPKNLSRYLANRLRSAASRLQVKPADTAYDLLLALGRPPVLSSKQALARIDQAIARGLDRFFADYDAGTVFAR